MQSGKVFQYARRRHLALEKKKIFIKISSRLCLITVSLLEISSIIVLFKKSKIKKYPARPSAYTSPGKLILQLKSVFRDSPLCSLISPPLIPRTAWCRQASVQGLLEGSDFSRFQHFEVSVCSCSPSPEPRKNQTVQNTRNLFALRPEFVFLETKSISGPHVERRWCSCAPLLQ